MAAVAELVSGGSGAGDAGVASGFRRPSRTPLAAPAVFAPDDAQRGKRRRGWTGVGGTQRGIVTFGHGVYRGSTATTG